MNFEEKSNRDERKKEKISIVIPAYNEEQNIVQLHQSLEAVLAKADYSIEYIFIDDGSKDFTLEKIKGLSTDNVNVFYIQLSRNFGHQNALKSGLDFASGDCVITMDCDLQHPPEVVLRLIKKWEEGYDVVFTKRIKEAKLPWMKRLTSFWFYWLLNKLSDLEIDSGTADFRLMSKQVVDAFRQLRESELFIRGLIKWAGFRQIGIDYVPNARLSGDSKYTFARMLSFAFTGFTSFTTKPLKIVAYTGLLLFGISTIILVPYAIISYVLGKAVSGWTSIMITIIFFGSLQILMLGLIGLYVGKVTMQAKHRPLYLIKDSNYVKN